MSRSRIMLFPLALVAAALLVASPGRTLAEGSDDDDLTSASVSTSTSAGGPFARLAGPGGSVKFVTQPGPNGETASVKAATAADGSFSRLQATGSLTLDCPTMHLKCRSLDYNGARLVAKDAVKVTMESVDATCETLDYDLDSGIIELTGKPDVRQKSETSVSHFSGMDKFHLKRAPDGTTEVRLGGEENISIDIQPAEPKPGATPAPTPAPGADSNPKGLSGLGKSVNIQVSPKGDQMPEVYSSATKEGNIGLFKAIGAVAMKTDTMDLRSEQLIVDGPEQRVEALSGVYLRQDSIDADCGKMVYNMATRVITLSVNPDVRQSTPKGITHISNMDSFVVNRKADGSVDTEAKGGPNGPPTFEYRAYPAASQAAPAPDSTPVELKIDGEDADLSKLRTGKK